MSQGTPQPSPVYVVAPPAPAPTNSLGVAGLIVSIIGWVMTCGLLCPIGLLLSFFGLFKRPRGLAVAGFIIGGAGSLFAVFVGFTIVMGVLGFKQGVESMGRGLTNLSAQATIDEAYARNNNTLPTDSEGNALIVSKNIQLNGERPVYAVTSATTYTLTMPGKDGTLGTADDVSQSCTAGGMAPRTQTQPFGGLQPGDRIESIEPVEDFVDPLKQIGQDQQNQPNR